MQDTTHSCSAQDLYHIPLQALARFFEELLFLQDMIYILYFILARFIILQDDLYILLIVFQDFIILLDVCTSCIVFLQDFLILGDVYAIKTSL